MEKLVQKVNAILEASFPGIEVAVVVKRGIKRVTGFVIWSGFAGQPQLERQSRLWKVLKANLSQEEELTLGNYPDGNATRSCSNERSCGSSLTYIS